MGTISIEGIRVYAPHGCMEEEATTGGNYIVDVHLEFDLSRAAASDNLSDTADYVLVAEIVQSEMAIRSKLIEHAAGRIAEKIKSGFSVPAGSIRVKVSKLHPPVNGEVESVSVTVTA